MLNTYAGLVPEERQITYVITTDKAQEFLQKKFNFVVKMMNEKINKENRENGDNIPIQEAVTVTLNSTKCGESVFAPFTILLPLNVLSKKRQKQVDGELEMFNPDSTTPKAALKPNFWDLLSCYMYNDSDVSSFFSNEFRRTFRISYNVAEAIKGNRRPNIQTFGKDKRYQYVTCIIDPIRVFHDMLTSKDDKTAFGVFITDSKTISAGHVEYTVVREVRKAGKGHSNFTEDLSRDISRRLGVNNPRH